MQQQPADDDLVFVAQRFARNPGAPGVPALDALTLPQSEPAGAAVKCELTVLGPDGKPAAVFHPGDEIKFRLQNQGTVAVYFQLVATDAHGTQFVMRAGELEPRGGDEPRGGEISVPGRKVDENADQEQLTSFA